MIAIAQGGIFPSPEIVQNTTTNVPLPRFTGITDVATPMIGIADPEDAMWTVLASDRQGYSQFFKTVCSAYEMSFMDAAASMGGCNLPQETLVSIFTVADLDRNQSLNEDQFVIAMHLAKLVKLKLTAIPKILPAKLVQSAVSPRLAIMNQILTNIDRTNDFLASKSTAWEFSNGRLTDEEALFIAKQLFRNDNRHVTSLKLQSMQLGTHAVAALSKMLIQNTGLLELSMDNSEFLAGAYSVFFAALNSNNTLRSLSLNGTNMGDVEAAALIPVLTTTSNLREIYLLQNNFSPSTVSSLLNAGRANPFIGEIKVSQETQTPGFGQIKEYATTNRRLSLERFSVDARSPGSKPTAHIASPVQQTSLVSFKANIDAMQLTIRQSMKVFDEKLSLSRVEDILAISNKLEDQYKFMILQTPIWATNSLTTLLSIPSIRETLLTELNVVSSEIAGIIGKMDRLCADRASLGHEYEEVKVQVCEDVFQKHRSLDAKHYLHENVSLFSFYRGFQLNLCDLILACVLGRNSFAMRTNEVSHSHILPSAVKNYITSIAEGTPDNACWILDFSENISRRITLRYEAQIRLLGPSEILLLCECATVRAVTSMKHSQGHSTFQAGVNYIVESIGDANIKSRYQAKSVNILMLNIKWNLESIFLKPGLAVPQCSGDTDGEIAGDDIYSLFTGQHIRAPKYGFRIASQNELISRSSTQEMQELPSPPQSRWISESDSIRASRARHIAMHASSAIPQIVDLKESVSLSTAPGAFRSQSVSRKGISTRISGMFQKRTASLSRRDPMSGDSNTDIITKLEKQLKEERQRRVEVERELAALKAIQRQNQ
uniref:EH domain-containing protein n=3 Tax=Spongospora subterranea TaxID=70186 RepID=A0A0H5QGH6_9EUKA|eukprot:CRZ00702.1 hypothetical protein [Spongospora subterranea]